MDPNWNEYRAEFPDRYWEHSVFDDALVSFLKKRRVDKCVDIGGGVFGTQVLEQQKFSTFLLDPNVENCPAWMAGRVNWGDHLFFDLAVARGSINYLTNAQLSQLRNMIRPKGCIIANTFLTPPSSQWRKRDVRNGAGENGVEWVRLHNGMVEHILEYPQRKIEHQFYFRSQDDFQNFLPGCRFIQHGANSFTLFWDAA